jgi:carbon-monoxide dehydrogenase medium subunit
MINVREFHYPTSVKDALALLARLDGKGMVVAGGTTLSTWKDPKVTALVDITRLGLSFVKKDGAGVTIGATTSMRDLTEHELVKGFAGGILGTAAMTVKSHLIRNAMTLGGHIVPNTLWTEASPTLLALDAKVKLALPGGQENTVPYATFVAEGQYRRLGRREIVVSVTLDGAYAKAGASLQHLQRTTAEPAWSQVAAVLTANGGGIERARIAVGNVTARATRFERAEKLLAGKTFHEGLFSEAARAVQEDLECVPDFRSSEEYRQDLTGVLVRRALDEAWRRAR